MPFDFLISQADTVTIGASTGVDAQTATTAELINSTQATRRIDLPVNADYGSDVEMVKGLLIEFAKKHPLVLKEPAPFSRMVKMSDSSIEFVLRVWALSDDFWQVTFDLNEQVCGR